MPELNYLENLVNRAVDDVLKNLLPTLREQLVKQVMQALQPALASTGAETPAPAAAPTDDTEKLNRCLTAIQTGTTQVEILDALIEAASNFASRTGLFVVRGANAVGWRARGFNDNEAVRSTPLELTFGLAAKAIQARGPVAGPSSEFSPESSQKFEASAQDGLMLPLLVRDKAVALIYADGGPEGKSLDTSALQTLVRTTGLWLEVFATRKASGAPASAPPAPAVQPQAMAAAATPAVSVAAPAPAPVAAPAPEPPRVEVAPPPPPPAPVAIPAGEEGEVHKKARRFAKLLVDEIKLYNQAKVTEGRQHRDLYDRLKDDIEKSRASYEKRYGSTVAKDGNYFSQELVRILADNDATLLGNNFPG